MYLILLIAMLILFFSFYSNSVQLKVYEWDYRWDDYPSRARDRKHPCDQSLATYRGHSVLQTLIRCYFSPAYRYFINHGISLVKRSTKHEFYVSLDLLQITSCFGLGYFGRLDGSVAPTVLLSVIDI